MTPTAPLRTCSMCKKGWLEAEFIGRSGKSRKHCATCQAKYYDKTLPLASATSDTPSGIRVGSGCRSIRTESLREMKRALGPGRRHLRLVEDFDGQRPKTRGDCANVERPCPYISCAHHLYIDVSESGSIVFNHPDIEPGDLPPENSCALDIADRGGATQLEVGELTNVSRERVRQIEEEALEHVRSRSKLDSHHAARLLEFCSEPNVKPRTQPKVGTLGSKSEPPDPLVEEESIVEPPMRVSFFAEGEESDEQVCDSVWQMFARDSNNRAKETGNEDFVCRSEASIRSSAQLLARKDEAMKANKYATGPVNTTREQERRLRQARKLTTTLETTEQIAQEGDPDGGLRVKGEG